MHYMDIALRKVHSVIYNYSCTLIHNYANGAFSVGEGAVIFFLNPGNIHFCGICGSRRDIAYYSNFVILYYYYNHYHHYYYYHHYQYERVPEKYMYFHVSESGNNYDNDYND